MVTRKQARQLICREYLNRLKGLAKRFGLRDWLQDLIELNKRGDCVATSADLDMLSRLVDADRIERNQIPHVLGVSYRYCCEHNLFERIRKFERDGIYSRNDTMLLKLSEFSKSPKKKFSG